MNYKIGDKVKIISNLYKHKFDIGETVTITEVFDEHYRAENSESYCFIDDNEIEMEEK